MLDALTAFGTPSGDIVAERFTGPDLILMLGREPFRVDLLTHIPGVGFEDAWQRRLSLTLDGVTIPPIAREDLITNEKAVGRLQDLADVEALEVHLTAFPETSASCGTSPSGWQVVSLMALR